MIHHKLLSPSSESGVSNVKGSFLSHDLNFIELLVWAIVHAGCFFIIVRWKKVQNLKFENYVLFGEQIEDLSSRVRPSDSSEGLFQITMGGDKKYSFCKNR